MIFSLLICIGLAGLLSIPVAVLGFRRTKPLLPTEALSLVTDRVLSSISRDRGANANSPE